MQPGRARRLTRGTGGRWLLEVVRPDDRLDVAASNVILADGGFQSDRSRLKRYVGTDQLKLRGAGSATGDGSRIGMSVGAQVINMEGFYGHLLAREALHRNDLSPYPILDVLAAAGIIVTTAGRRIVDEADNGVSTTNAVAWSAEPLACWLICDSETWENEGRVGITPPNPHLLDHGATVIRADALSELADRCAIVGQALEETVTSTSEAGGRPPRTGRVALRRPPWYAVPVVAGVTFTLGGLRVDGQA